MSIKSQRILISCLVISAIVLLCLGALAAGGVGVWALRPAIHGVSLPSEEALPQETARPTPTRAVQLQPESTQIQQPEGAAPTQESSQPQQTVIPTPGLAPGASLPEDVIRQMDEIEGQVTALRRLAPMEPVDRSLLTPAQLREHVINDFLADYSEEEARDDAIELSAFGLLVREFDLYNLYLDLYSEQVAGFYDDDVKAMYVIQGEGFQGPERLTYAHEYVHALQDQHYQLKEGLKLSDDDCEEDSERCAAVRALVEGDASFVEMQWFFDHSTDQDQRELREFYNSYESPVFDSTPSFLRESFLFPYTAGQEFVEYLYDLGGWDAIEEAYRNPPTTTEQILHPERYPDDAPIPVTLPDFTDDLGEGWRELNRNVMGEYYTYLILAHGEEPRARLRENEAREAAAGWGGDLYVIYHNEESEEIVMVMNTEWETANDARQFSNAFNKYASGRFGNPVFSRPGASGWESSESYTYFIHDGDQTTWILAPSRDIAETIWESVRAR